MLQIRRDEVDDQDVLQYSTTNAKPEGGDENELAFSSGGAIAEALAESDPSILT